jgi:hypothetical protein
VDSELVKDLETLSKGDHDFCLNGPDLQIKTLSLLKSLINEKSDMVQIGVNGVSNVETIPSPTIGPTWNTSKVLICKSSLS